MPETWILQASKIVTFEEFQRSGANEIVYEFGADIITPQYTLRNFKIKKNFAFGLNDNKDAVLIIDLDKNPKIKLVLKPVIPFLN